MKKFVWRMLAVALALCTLPCGPSALAVGEAEMAESNVALCRPVTASSAADKAPLAVDGINQNSDYTYWQPEAGDKEPWLMVDLEIAYPIARIELEVQKGADSSCKNFEVWGSNDSEFGEYAVLAKQEGDAAKNGVYSKDSLSKKSFRYIKVVKTKSDEAFTIAELRVWVVKDKIQYGTQLSGNASQIPDWSGGASYTIPADVAGTSLERPFRLLAALNIMRGYPDGNFLPEESITRAEFVTTAMKMAGMQAELFAEEPTYSDVPKTHWAFASIEAATKIGLVGGVGEGMFAPEERVTTAQAVRVMVSLLGYEYIAQSKGGYSTGYFQVADQLRLLKNITCAADASMERRDVAELLYQTLHARVLTTAVGGKGELEKQDYTLLNANFGIYKESGLVTATEQTGLTNQAGSASAGYVKINDIAMRCDMPGSADYIGLPVEYYYHEESGSPVIVLMLVSKTAESFTVQAEDVLSFTDDGNFEYETDEGERTKRLRVSTEADIIYNGKALPGASFSQLIPESGTITLTDINGDGTIELVSVRAVAVHVVKYANKAEEMIAFSDTNEPLRFNSSDDSVTILMADTQKEVTLDELKEWDVVSILESKNTSGAKQLTVYVSRNSTMGTLTELSDDTAHIGKTSYKLAECIAKGDLTVGMRGTFYLDMEGRIAAFDGESANGEYGYLTAIAKGTGVNQSLKIKMFTKKGVFEEFTCSDNFTVDGLSLKTFTELENHLLKNGRVDGEIHQAVRYKKNSKKEITYMDTAFFNPKTETKENLTKEISAYKADGTANDRTVYGAVFDCEFSYDPNAVIFQVPDDMSRENAFGVLSIGTFRNGGSYAVDAYDGGIERKMKLFLLTDASASSISNRSEIMLVEKVITALDASGEARQRLDGYYAGEKISCFEYEEGMLEAEKVKQGDILQVTLNMANEIKSLRRLFERDKAEAGEYVISEKYPEYARTTDAALVMRNNFYIGYGRVISRDGNVITLQYVTNVEETLRKTVTVDLAYSRMKLYMYDSTANNDASRVRLATPADFLDAASVGDENASMAFVYITSVEPFCAIVIK